MILVEATLKVVVNNMDGERWCTSTEQLQETLLQVCEAVRRMCEGCAKEGCAKDAWGIKKFGGGYIFYFFNPPANGSK